MQHRLSWTTRRALLAAALFFAPCAARAAPGAEAPDAAGADAVAALVADEAPGAALGRRLAAGVDAGALARALIARRDLAPPVLRSLGAALAAGEVPDRELAGYLVDTARALGRDLARRGPPFADAEVELLLTVQLVDPLRFVAEPAFRRTVLALLPHALAPEVPPALRDRLLVALNQVRAVSFDAAERVAVAWGAAARASGDRYLPYAAARLAPPPPQGPIAASLYSLPSRDLTAEEADRFLAAVEAHAPGRDLVVLADLPLRTALAVRRRGARTRLVESWGRGYTPWPRDALLFTRDRDGGVVVVERPNRQPGREDDGDLGRALVQGLPRELDAAWGEVGLAVAPTPFHNGQVLLTGEAAWLSLHALELRTLELLGVERVPVERFVDAAGVDGYLAAVRAAAAELAPLYGRPVRFVHPLPDAAADLEARRALLERLGGGAGFDLDSLLTLVPSPDGRLHAFVADLAAGRRLLARLGAGDWQRLRDGYRLTAPAEALPPLLAAALDAPRARRLAPFLDAVAGHLAGEGLAVARLPLLLVPGSLADGAEAGAPPFLITWNNVVVEYVKEPAAGDGARVEAAGFASFLDPGDDLARAVFAGAGCRLELLPPLVASVVRNGGYRCASSHLR